MTKIAGSGNESGSISQRHGSADPDPYQNVMDPQHCSNDNILKPINLVQGYLYLPGRNALRMLSHLLQLTLMG